MTMTTTMPAVATTTATRQREQRRRAMTRDTRPVSDAPEHAPLEVLDDQQQLWLAHGATPITYEAAVERVLAERAADGDRVDHLADLRLFGFGAIGGVAAIQQKAGLDLHGDGAPIRLRKRAFQNLCASVGVRAEFIAGLPAKLQALNMNWLMAHGQREHAPVFMRRAGTDLRSIHSDRYAAFDDDMLLDIVDSVLVKSGYRKDAMVRASCIGPQMTLRISVPNEGVEIQKGDVIEWGIDVGNSEVGLRSVQVCPSTYRLVCLNGMRSTVQGATTRIRHVGDHKQIREDLEVAIPAAFGEARGDIDRWKKSVDTMIDDALADLEGLAGFGLEKGEVRAIGRELIGAPEYMPAEELAGQLRHRRTTAFDLTNAITATARERSDVGARMSLEETAHKYLMRKVG